MKINRSSSRLGARREGGFALFLGMIFLLMITLVSVTAMRGTALELNMANNTANHEIAFEGAEVGRSALLRSLRDVVACQFKWANGTKVTGSTATACITGCTAGMGGLESTVDYLWEDKLTIDDVVVSRLEFPATSENTSDPDTYIDRFNYKFATAGEAAIQAVFLPAAIVPGNAAAQSQGYEQATGGSKGGSARYFDVQSQADLANARASAAGHYRLMMREASPDTCLTDLAYGT